MTTNNTIHPLYERGTISLIQNSEFITGSGTFWQHRILKYGQLNVHGQVGPFYIKEVISDTQIRINRPWPYVSMPEANYIIFSQHGSITDAILHDIVAAAQQRAEKSLAVHVFQPHEIDVNGDPLDVVGNDYDLGYLLDQEGNILTSWQKLGGEWGDGADLKGGKGDTGTLAVGQVNTGQPGSNASVTNSGTNQEAIFDFTIPRGNQGEQGPSGQLTVGQVTTGSPGTDVEVVNSGTTENAALDFIIPRGDQGPSGKLSVGQVTTGAANTDVVVTNTGTLENAIMNFTIPRGSKGNKGDEGAQGNPGPALVVEVEGPFADRSLYDNEPKGFSFFATDQNSIYHRNSDTAGTWIGPIAVGTLKPIFYGFRVDENYNFIVEQPDGEINLVDYPSHTICPGVCQFTLENGQLKQTL